MAIHGEDFFRCPGCGQGRFREEKLVVLAKAQRLQPGMPAFTLNTDIEYVCATPGCGRRVEPNDLPAR